MVFKILILDRTSVDIRRYMNMPVWRECGFEIIGHTFDLTEAVSPIAKSKYDMLLCVNRETSMIAAEALRYANRKKIDIPTIVISHAESSKDMRDCFLLGALDYLLEPASEEDIAAALKRASRTISESIMDREYSRAVSNSYSELNLTEDNAAMQDKLTEFLLKVRGKAVTVEEAADYFGFNPDYFRRIFKKRFGASFSDFYKRLMMDYAKLLLSSGHYKVGEVSELLGFSSSDYFTRVFKKITGHLPSEYRK